MKTLRSHLNGQWIDGNGAKQTLVNPATEEVLAELTSPQVDWKKTLAWTRDVGGRALRAMTFAQRGAMLKAASKLVHAHRDELIGLAIANGGNTRGDAKFDIDGAIATLAHYAELGTQLGSLKALRDGEPVQLGRTARYA